MKFCGYLDKEEICAIHRGAFAGICVSDNIEAIGKAIDYFYTHQDIEKQMGEAGKLHVTKKYNWKKEEKKLCEFYGVLVKERK